MNQLCIEVFHLTEIQNEIASLHGILNYFTWGKYHMKIKLQNGGWALALLGASGALSHKLFAA